MEQQQQQQQQKATCCSSWNIWRCGFFCRSSLTQTSGMLELLLLSFAKILIDLQFFHCTPDRQDQVFKLAKGMDSVEFHARTVFLD